jgi:hypothetical protein
MLSFSGEGLITVSKNHVSYIWVEIFVMSVGGFSFSEKASEINVFDGF